MAVKLTFTNLDNASIDVIVREDAAYIIADRIAELTESLTKDEVLKALDATNVNINVNVYTAMTSDKFRHIDDSKADEFMDNMIKYYAYIEDKNGYTANRIFAHNLEEAEETALKYFQSDPCNKGKTLIIKTNNKIVKRILL